MGCEAQQKNTLWLILIVANALEEGDDIFRRYVNLKMVRRGQNITTIPGKGLDTTENFSLHVLPRTSHSLPYINPTHKAELFAEFPL